MLFRKKIEPSCSYCKQATVVDEDTILCLKKGVTNAGTSCGSFVYDPFKRVPPVPAQPDFSRLKAADFSLALPEEESDSTPAEPTAPEDTAAEPSAGESTSPAEPAEEDSPAPAENT